MKKVVILFLFLALCSSFVFAGTLSVTNEHPFLIKNEWIPAKQLVVGDLLTTSDGKKARITKIEKIEENIPVYNLEDSYYHNYVVSQDNLIVHNSNGKKKIFSCPGCIRRCPNGIACGGQGPEQVIRPGTVLCYPETGVAYVILSVKDANKARVVKLKIGDSVAYNNEENWIITQFHNDGTGKKVDLIKLTGTGQKIANKVDIEKVFSDTFFSNEDYSGLYSWVEYSEIIEAAALEPITISMRYTGFDGVKESGKVLGTGKMAYIISDFHGNSANIYRFGKEVRDNLEASMVLVSGPDLDATAANDALGAFMAVKNNNNYASWIVTGGNHDYRLLTPGLAFRKFAGMDANGKPVFLTKQELLAEYNKMSAAQKKFFESFATKVGEYFYLEEAKFKVAVMHGGPDESAAFAVATARRGEPGFSTRLKPSEGAIVVEPVDMFESMEAFKVDVLVRGHDNEGVVYIFEKGEVKRVDLSSGSVVVDLNKQKVIISNRDLKSGWYSYMRYDGCGRLKIGLRALPLD